MDRVRALRRSLLAATLLVAGACSSGEDAAELDLEPVGEPSTLGPPLAEVEVLDERLHDPNAFTQGLVLDGGQLFESTGGYGVSDLRELDPDTGETLRRTAVDPEYFAEGLALVGDRLIQITWNEETALVYDRDTLELVDEIPYEGEGWGLCYDGTLLVMSDGSDQLTFRDPETFESQGEITVTVDGEPVDDLNELECVGNHIYANVWHQDDILVIERQTGEAEVIDASGVLQPRPGNPEAVLNGIAFDPESETFLVTGKLWPSLFEVRLAEPTED